MVISILQKVKLIYGEENFTLTEHCGGGVGPMDWLRKDVKEMSSPTPGPHPDDLSGLTTGNHKGFTCQTSGEKSAILSDLLHSQSTAVYEKICSQELKLSPVSHGLHISEFLA